MLQIAVLGLVEVRADGLAVPVPGGRTSELLVRLALEAGVAVRAERLVEDLWGEEAVTTSRNTLQSKVARLRKALGDPALLTGSDAGYTLAVAPLQVDALAVLGAAEEAARLLAAGESRRSAEVSAAALARFRGELLAGAGDGGWVGPHRTRLEEARLTLIETGLAARLELGEARDVVGELEAAVAAAPFQEGLWALLITALYRAGRQADALAAYQRVRHELAEGLGLDPGPRLQALQRQVLDHDPALTAPLAAAPSPTTPRPGHGPDCPPGNLPSIAVELVGRDRELAAARDLLAERRLVELVGPGGIGKTALASAAGRDQRQPGGTWLVRLESATTADEVLDTVLAALGVTGGEPALMERLRAAPTLLILDNCEHVLEPAADLATRLLDGAPPLRILATSQAPLELDGEAILELGPLALDDAVALFTRRAAARRRASAATDATEGVHDLCRSLDGLPLAIELAAARTKTLSIAEITRRLDDRFSVLHDPASRRPERRRALRATIGWSYELLFPDDQRGLWALATFAGGASLDAVESVLAALDVPPSAAIDVVERLASRSLVIVDGGGPAPVRYRLLDSIRAFALEALAEAGLAEQAVAAHATWFAVAADHSTDGVRSAEQADHLAFVRRERANIDVALAWSVGGDPALALRIARGFGWAWIVLGDHRGAQRILVALEAAGARALPPDRIDALLLAGWIEASTDRVDLAGEHVAEAAALAGSTGDVELQARAAYHLAYVVSHRGEFRRGLELTTRSSALLEGLDRPWDRVANGLFATRAAISAGDLPAAEAARDEVERWLEHVEDPWLRVRRDAMLGELARVGLRFEDAARHLARAAEASGRLGFLQTEAYQVSSLGRAQWQAGDDETAAATLAVAIDKAEATGDVRMAALARVHLGRMLRGLGRSAEARATLEAASAWHHSAGGGEQQALGDALLAALDVTSPDPAQRDAAAARLSSLLTTASGTGDAPVEVLALDALARVAADDGKATTAAALAAEADARMPAAAHFITERDRVDAHAARQLS